MNSIRPVIEPVVIGLQSDAGEERLRYPFDRKSHGLRSRGEPAGEFVAERIVGIAVLLDDDAHVPGGGIGDGDRRLPIVARRIQRLEGGEFHAMSFREGACAMFI